MWPITDAPLREKTLQAVAVAEVVATAMSAALKDLWPDRKERRAGVLGQTTLPHHVRCAAAKLSCDAIYPDHSDTNVVRLSTGRSGKEQVQIGALD